MMVISSFCFATIAALVKFLKDIPLVEIIFFRNLPLIIFLSYAIKKEKISFFGKNKFWLSIRCVSAFLAVWGHTYTIRTMPITNAVTIKQLIPLFVILIAKIILKEKILKKQIPIFFIAFLGVLLLIKPGFNLNFFPALIGIIAAIFAAMGHCALRQLRLSDHPLVIVFYYGAFGVLMALIILILGKFFVIPNFLDSIVLLLIGLLNLLSQTTLARAYKLAPASLVSHYMYSQIVFVFVFGIIFFNEAPGLLSSIGSLIIIFSGYFNYKVKLDKSDIIK
jgi:drug/metabolite transporter (DMT)-like permease